MNGKQRVDAVLKGEWPDKRPVLLHNFMIAAKEYDVCMKMYRENPEIIAKVHIYSVEKYDLDEALIDIDTAILAGQWVCRLIFLMIFPREYINQ